MSKIPAAETDDQQRSIPAISRDVSPEFRSLLPYFLRGVSFKNKRQLGHGSYAIVKEVDLNGKKCAAKQLHALLYESATAQQKTDMLKRFADECKLLQSVKHPNIVEFVGVHLDKGSQLPLLVMELLDATWSSYLETHGIPDTATYLDVLCDVANGLNFLHQHSPTIIHRDLSANNVLLSSTMQAKISDLGVAKVLNFTPSQLSRMTKAPGTPAYMPPEALTDAPKYTTSIDVFSFGILMLHTLCGEWPMPDPATKVDPENPDRIVAVTEFERRKRFVDKIDHKHWLMKQIEQCLHNNPKKRPDVANLLETLVYTITTNNPIHSSQELMLIAENQNGYLYLLCDCGYIEHCMNSRNVLGLKLG